MVCGEWLCVGYSRTRKPVWLPPWTWWPLIVVTGITVSALMRACINVLGLNESASGALWFIWMSTLGWYALAFVLNSQVDRMLGVSEYDLGQVLFGWPTMWMQAAIMETLNRSMPSEGADLILSAVVWFIVFMITLATQLFNATHYPRHHQHHHVLEEELEEEEGEEMFTDE
jgi:hypothetical protein